MSKSYTEEQLVELWDRYKRSLVHTYMLAGKVEHKLVTGAAKIPTGAIAATIKKAPGTIEFPEFIRLLED